MPNLPFTLRQLEVFSILCSTCSFREAAEQLGITQASVSNQIKALEEGLGMKLFQRISGKRPLLTVEGLDFLDDLGAFTLAASKLAAHREMQALPEERTLFRINTGQTIADYYIRPKLDRFLIENPDIVLEFHTQFPSDRTGEDVEKAGFDFALLHVREDLPVNPAFREIALLSGGIYGHRNFAEGRELPLQPDYLNTLPFILSREGSPQEREARVALRKAGITPQKIVSHTQYFDVIANMLAQGLGVASFAEVILPPELRDTVILLYPLLNWRLIFYRKIGINDAKAKQVENFLLSSLIDDPNYPMLSLA